MPSAGAGTAQPLPSEERGKMAGRTHGALLCRMLNILRKKYVISIILKTYHFIFILFFGVSGFLPSQELKIIC